MVIDLKNIIKNYTKEYREYFIKFIDGLSEKYDSFKWWCSSVSEKNVVDENSLFKILNKSDLTEKDNYKFSLKKYYKFRRRFIVEKFKDIFKISKIDIKKKYIGLLTWIDKRNFDIENNFKETYYSGLYENFKNKDDFLFLINPLYTIEKNEAYKKINNQKIKFIDFFKCYKKIDVLKSIFLSLFYNPIKQNIFFQNKKITSLLKNKFLKDLEENRYAQYYLMYYSIKRIAEKGIKFDRIIYPFENQPWEKILCYAVRKYMPDTKLIGYMHTMTLPNLVSMFSGEYEKNNMPQPDYVFTAGKLTADELRKYWNPEMVIENCAFRYEYLFSEFPEFRNSGNPEIRNSGLENSKRITILLALSVDYKKSLEMIKMTYEAFKDKKEYKIIIKSHPTYNLKLEDCGIDGLNEIEKSEDSKIKKSNEQISDIEYNTSHIKPDINYDSTLCTISISDSPVSVLLSQCDLVITSESTVGLEGIKLGKPMIELNIEGFIPLSRFDYCPEIKISASDSKELFEKVNQVINWNINERKKYFEKANEFIDYCFNKPSGKYIKMFLEV